LERDAGGGAPQSRAAAMTHRLAGFVPYSRSDSQLKEKPMKRVIVFPLVAALLLAVALPAFAVGKGKAVYIGGTITGIKEKTEAPIDVKGDLALNYVHKDGTLTIPWVTVQELEYGQKVGHRIATAILLSPLALFKKARHHYVTVGYKDTQDKDQAVVFEFGKDDIRLALATLKARTGKELTFTDDEARKQMGGGAPPTEAKN
jgi:hypothetical protein